jgi:membrane protein insertase Oxa1/YidC/SpoIIIJ
VKEFVQRFFANMSKPPEPGPELIPTRWRIPFFIGLAVVSLAALVLLVRLVVVPGIAAQQSATQSAPQSAPSK